MFIYNLDEVISKSSKNKDTWSEQHFYKCIDNFEKKLSYKSDWDYGENWCRFYFENKLVGMLCFPIPFMISNSNLIAQDLPFNLEIIIINNFDEDKIILSKSIQDLIEPMSQELECPAFIQDLYVTTV